MTDRTCSILFLCTGNSARSILAEAILDKRGEGRFRAFSAGSFPAGRVHPFAIDLLQAKGFDTGGLRSKSWDEFSAPGAPEIDIVITVCDNASNEVCPVWPGRPVTAHWGIPDPAAVEGPEAERRRAFDEAFRTLNDRIGAFVDLPAPTLDDRSSLRRHLDEIAKSPAETG